MDTSIEQLHRVADYIRDLGENDMVAELEEIVRRVGWGEVTAKMRHYDTRFLVVQLEIKVDDSV